MKKLILIFILLFLTVPSFATIWNVKNAPCSAVGDGVHNDTPNINTCIGDLVNGDTLLFPAGTYLVTSLNAININNVTIDGSSNAATIKSTTTQQGPFFRIGQSGLGSVTLACSGWPGIGAGQSLSSTANETSTSFTTSSTLSGVITGSYVLLLQGGSDSSGGSGPTTCDTSGCRSEFVKITNVSSNTYTVDTMLHDTWSTVNNARACPVTGMLSGITLQNITFDGGTTTAQTAGNSWGVQFNNTVNSTISGVTCKNTLGSCFLHSLNYGDTFSNITITGAGSENCGAAWQGYGNSNITENTISLSSLNPGIGLGSCNGDGAFGLEDISFDNSTAVGVTVDSTNAGGRPMKLTASRWSTYNSLIVKNGHNTAGFNGLSLEYYSAHNLFNTCSILSNAGSGGSGSAGINSFGNYNQFNTYVGCMVTGNGNQQIYVSSFDALRGGNDSNQSFFGNNIGGSGTIGLAQQGKNACVIGNIFQSGMSAGISVDGTYGTGSIGNSNTLNGNSSNLAAGSCSISGANGAGPLASLNSVSLLFGNQPITTTSTSQSIVITNGLSGFNGTNTLTFVGTPTLQIGTQFAISANTCTSTVAAGATCTTTITFTPTALGAKNDTLTFLDNAGGAYQVVKLNGVGVTSTSCGLPGVSTNQSCFNTSIGPVPLPNPIPSWGPNTSAVVAAGGNPYLMQAVGNLTGAGTSVTPTDFGLPVMRCTDSTFFGGLFWGLSDSGAPNLFNSNDSLLLAKANGGTHYLIHFDSNTGACLPVLGITYSRDALFSHTSPNTIYTLIGTNSNQLYQDTISVTCSPACSGSVTAHTLLYDFATANCLQNSYNGNPTWAGGGSVGVFSSSLDDTTFSNYFSDTGVTGQRGRWAAAWNTSYGSGNCDLLDTQSMKYRSHGGTQSVTAITPAWKAGDRFALHETYSALNNNYIILSAAVNSYTYGEYSDALYFWQIGTANVTTCGYETLTGANPISGSSVLGNITSGTFTLGETVTQTGTGAHAVVIAPLVIAAMPLVIGTITGTPNGTGTWVGGSSHAVFTPTASPALNATVNYACGGHFGQGYTQLVTGKNGIANSYVTPSMPLTSTAPGSAPCSDSHYSWNFTNTTDSSPALITTQGYGALAFANLATLQVVGSATKCATDPTFAGIPLYYDENYYNNIGTGKVLRTNHTFNSGWSWSFDVQNAGVGIESSSGKWHMFLTDGWGQFGSTDGNAEANIGGPDWNNSFTGFITGTGFGSFIMPQASNAGHYVYHVASCSGSPCTTGATAPTWPQTAMPHTTVVDGNVTWETYPDAHNSAISAVSNVRSEIMLVHLFNGVAPPPTAPPGSLFSIQSLLSGGSLIQ